MYNLSLLPSLSNIVKQFVALRANRLNTPREPLLPLLRERLLRCFVNLAIQATRLCSVLRCRYVLVQ